MKYFITNKEETYLDFIKITSDDFKSLKEKTIEEIFVASGTFESIKDPSSLIEDIKKATDNKCKIALNFINIYQLFVDVAFHRTDIGIGHLVCRSMENPFNVNAASAFVKKSGLKIVRTNLEENSKFIRIECVNEWE